MVEADFLHLSQVGTSFGWQPQAYNVTAEDARGSFGKQAETGNVIPNPLKDANAWLGEAVNGGDAGLQMWVRGQDSNGMVPMAEIDGTRSDLLYGSFRIGMKATSVNGTCGAFFWVSLHGVDFCVARLTADHSTATTVRKSTLSFFRESLLLTTAPPTLYCSRLNPTIRVSMLQEHHTSARRVSLTTRRRNSTSIASIGFQAPSRFTPTASC